MFEVRVYYDDEDLKLLQYPQLVYTANSRVPKNDQLHICWLEEEKFTNVMMEIFDSGLFQETLHTDTQIEKQAQKFKMMYESVKKTDHDIDNPQICTCTLCKTRYAKNLEIMHSIYNNNHLMIRDKENRRRYVTVQTVLKRYDSKIRLQLTNGDEIDLTPDNDIFKLDKPLTLKEIERAKEIKKLMEMRRLRIAIRKKRIQANQGNYFQLYPIIIQNILDSTSI